MNFKDMTDAELNEAIARIVGYERIYRNKADNLMGYHKSGDFVAQHAHLIPDYCNSPAAGAALKKWLLRNERARYVDTSQTTHATVITIGMLSGKLVCGYSGYLERALAEAVCMAFAPASEEDDDE